MCFFLLVSFSVHALVNTVSRFQSNYRRMELNCCDSRVDWYLDNGALFGEQNSIVIIVKLVWVWSRGCKTPFWFWVCFITTHAIRILRKTMWPIRTNNLFFNQSEANLWLRLCVFSRAWRWWHAVKSSSYKFVALSDFVMIGQIQESALAHVIRKLQYKKTALMLSQEQHKVYSRPWLAASLPPWVSSTVLAGCFCSVLVSVV